MFISDCLVLCLFYKRNRHCLAVFETAWCRHSESLRELVIKREKEKVQWNRHAKKTGFHQTNAITLAPCSSFFSIVPESLRWHLVYNNFTQAEKIIKRTVTFNNLSFPHKLFDKIKCDSMKKDTLSTQNRKANLLDVFRSSELRKNTLILSAMWWVLYHLKLEC